MNGSEQLSERLRLVSPPSRIREHRRSKHQLQKGGRTNCGGMPAKAARTPKSSVYLVLPGYSVYGLLVPCSSVRVREIARLFSTLSFEIF